MVAELAPPMPRPQSGNQALLELSERPALPGLLEQLALLGPLERPALLGSPERPASVPQRVPQARWALKLTLRAPSPLMLMGVQLAA